MGETGGESSACREKQAAPTTTGQLARRTEVRRASRKNWRTTKSTPPGSPRQAPHPLRRADVESPAAEKKSDATSRRFGCRASCLRQEKKPRPSQQPSRRLPNLGSNPGNCRSRFGGVIGSGAPSGAGWVRFSAGTGLAKLAGRHATTTPARSRPGPEKPTFAPAATIRPVWRACAWLSGGGKPQRNVPGIRQRAVEAGRPTAHVGNETVGSSPCEFLFLLSTRARVNSIASATAVFAGAATTLRRTGRDTRTDTGRASWWNLRDPGSEPSQGRDGDCVRWTPVRKVTTSKEGRRGAAGRSSLRTVARTDSVFGGPFPPAARSGSRTLRRHAVGGDSPVEDGH